MSRSGGATIALAVQDLSQVGEARRGAVTLAEAIGFGETGAGRVALVATELATNLARHGQGGELLLRRLIERGGGLELIAVDRGPGMANVDAALRDGFSTRGTTGAGLGAVRRLADGWDLFSTPGGGTAVLARLYAQGNSKSARGPSVAGVSRAAPGETTCGDAWAWSGDAGRWTVLVADGLGHGPLAATAGDAAVRVLAEHPDAAPAELVALAHDALRPTRGAAVGVAAVSPGPGRLEFAGIGNIGGAVVTGAAARNLVSLPGIVGHECRRIQAYSYDWSDASVLLLHSDGLQSRWALDRYPGIAGRDPGILAAVLYRDWTRGRDDVTVVAARGDRRP